MPKLGLCLGFFGILLTLEAEQPVVAAEDNSESLANQSQKASRLNLPDNRNSYWKNSAKTREISPLEPGFEHLEIIPKYIGTRFYTRMRSLFE